MKYILLLLILVSCGQSPKQEYNYKPQTLVDTLASPVKEDIKPEIFYTYIVFITEESNNEGIINKQQYTTEIDSTSKRISEDERYRILDEAESNIRDAELNDIEIIYNKPVRIISRDIKLFASYSEASISRQETLNKR